MELLTKSIIFSFKTGDILEVLLKLDLQIIKQASVHSIRNTKLAIMQHIFLKNVFRSVSESSRICGT